MKERPILMSGPMVRALLAGTKTQTRRVIKQQPCVHTGYPQPYALNIGFNRWHWYYDSATDGPRTPLYDAGKDWTQYADCPYGVPGDRLWVQEEHTVIKTDGNVLMVRYEADGSARDCLPTDREMALFRKRKFPFKATRARFMYRSFSRITLELTSVRVERLNDISEEDAKAEGAEQLYVGDPSREEAATGVWRDYQHNEKGQARFSYPRAKESYASLWENINGPGSWALNPWVWVLEFKLA